jgi:hypothetical protein
VQIAFAPLSRWAWRVENSTSRPYRSLDQAIRSLSQRWRNLHAEDHGGPEVDHELELGTLLDGLLTRPRPMKNSPFQTGSRKHDEESRPITATVRRTVLASYGKRSVHVARTAWIVSGRACGPPARGLSVRVLRRRRCPRPGAESSPTRALDSAATARASVKLSADDRGPNRKLASPTTCQSAATGCRAGSSRRRSWRCSQAASRPGYWPEP